MDLNKIFQKIKEETVHLEEIVYKVSSEFSVKFVIQVSPYRELDEIEELNQKHLVSDRKVNETIFIHSVIKINDLDLRKVDSIDISSGDEYSDIRDFYSDAKKVTVKEYLKFQAQAVLSGDILSRIAYVYNKKYSELSEDVSSNVHNKYLEELDSALDKADDTKETMAENKEDITETK